MEYDKLKYFETTSINNSLFNKIFVLFLFTDVLSLLLVSLLVQDFLGLLGGMAVFIVLDAILEVLRVMEDIGMILKILL
jgi:hypothetical protein